MQDRLKQFKASFTKSELDHARAELDRWNELDTWTFREGLLLMTGIDPYHSDDLIFTETGVKSEPNPSWARITEAPGIGLDSNGMPRPTGYVLNIFQFELMGRLLSLWTSNPAHTMQDRHPPAYYRQWAESKGFDTFLSLAAPVVTAAEPASDAPAPAAVPNWKMQIQAEATALVLQLRKSGANPTKHSILEPMAHWCRANNIKTDSGIFPSEGYLRTHVLGGKHWEVPD